jgi:hypothetical protein
MARYYCMHSSHAFLSACTFVLHMLFFLPAHMPYTCCFFCMHIRLPHRAFPSKMDFTQHAPNNDIVTHLESLPNSFMSLCIVSSSMNNIYAVIIKLALPYTMIFTVSPTGAPSLTGVGFSFCCFVALIRNYSSVVFTSCTCSIIESRWFSTFSHTSDSRSYIVVAIISTSFVVSDVSICFLLSFSFFLEPLACSVSLFLWASRCSDASCIHVSIPISFSNSLFTITSCASLCISSTLTYVVGPSGALYVACGPCVGPHYNFFCFLYFF